MHCMSLYHMIGISCACLFTYTHFQTTHDIAMMLYLSFLASILLDLEQLPWQVCRTYCVHTLGRRCAYSQGHTLPFSTVVESA